MTGKIGAGEKDLSSLSLFNFSYGFMISKPLAGYTMSFSS